MQGRLCGRGAVLTGPMTPLSAMVARRLGNEGAFLAFTGLGTAGCEMVQSLLYQFRDRSMCIEANLSDPGEVADALGQAERAAGPMELVVHTLGPTQASAPEGIEKAGHALVVRSSNAPLRTALSCTRGAMDYMRGRKGAHIVHLVSVAHIGAMEVEKVALARLQNAWGRRPNGSVRLSAILLEGESVLSGRSNQGAARILESFTGRLLEEDDWIRDVLMEREVGDLVLNVCKGTMSRAAGWAPAVSGAAGELMFSMVA